MNELFESMPVRRAVLSQAIPAVAAQMITLIYNLADTFFVGKLNDPNQMAAITVTYPVFLLMSAFSNLYGIGGASLIARSLGRGEENKARQVSAFCFWGTIVIAVIFSCIVFLFRNSLFYLCGANQDTIHYCIAYANWVLVLGGIPTILNGMLASLVRSVGYARQASFGVALGGILNIILDPVFCLPFGLGMGVAGAAMATFLSNLTAVLYFLIFLFRMRGKTALSFQLRDAANGFSYQKEIYSIGFPAALQSALTVISVAALNSFVAPYGTVPVAALGIMKKIDFLPLYVSLGMAQGVLPLIGYNYSAGNQKRVRDITLFAGVLSGSFSILCVIGFELFAESLVGLFIANTQTIEYGAAFLRRACIAMPFMSIGYLMTIKFQAMGKAVEALIMSVLRKGLLDIPLLFVMSAVFGLYGIVCVQPVVDTIAVAAAYFLNRKAER